MWAILIKGLNFLLGGFLEKYLNYLNEKDRIATERMGLELAEKAEAKANAAKVLIAETNHWFAWVVRPLFGIPTALYWCVIIADSIFYLEFDGVAYDVAALPPPYDQWGYNIMLSYVLVEGGMGITRIVGNRFGRK